VTIRPATTDDAAAVTALESSIFGTDAWSEASVRDELTGERRTALVACDPDVIGYAVTALAGDTTDLQRVVVAPDRRRRGVARALLDAVLPQQGRVLLEVSAANDGARAFYASAGFAEIDRRRAYYRDGSDAVVMLREGSR
jgi:[ribosomal protein S18]-alanine N-acetyltransferase